MKRILFLFFPIFVYLSGISAQSKKKIEGTYLITDIYSDKYSKYTNRSPDAYIFSNGTFALSFTDKTWIGTWKEHGNQLIMQPDTSRTEGFYIYASYNRHIKGISVQFINIEEHPSVCSINKGEKSDTMHLVSDPGFHCISHQLDTIFPRGEHTQLELAQLPDSYSDSTSSLPIVVYTFPLPSQYNEFKVEWRDVSPQNFEPILATIENNKLSFKLNSYSYEYTYINNLNKSEMQEFKEVEKMAAVANRPVKYSTFSQSDKKDRLIYVNYPIVPYIKKEHKNIIVDKNSLFKTKFPDYQPDDILIIASPSL